MPAVDPSTILAGINTAANIAGTVGSLMGGSAEGLSRQDQRFLADKSWKMSERQQDFLENQMYYRSKDAERAGLHPLAALGVMPTSGGVPVSVPGGRPAPSLGERLSSMGQNVSRAIQAQQSLPSRALLTQQLENEKAQGDFIRAQTAESLARARNLSMPPPFPQGSSNPYGFTGEAQAVGNRHVLIRNPDGTFTTEDSPTYGSTLYHRPVSSAGRDILAIMKDALRSVRDLHVNLYRHKRARNWKSEL